MNIKLDLPWEKDLSVNSYRFGRPAPGQKFRRRKPHVQAWMGRLEGECWSRRWVSEVANGGRLGFTTRLIPRVPVTVIIDFRWPDKRRRDSHNYFYCIANAVAKGLGIDDKDIRISTRSEAVDRERPGFGLEITDEEG